jgi:hypothetical protein
MPHIGGVGRDTLLCEPNWNVHQNWKPWLKTKTTSYLESFQLGSSYAAHVVLFGIGQGSGIYYSGHHLLHLYNTERSYLAVWYL